MASNLRRGVCLAGSVSALLLAGCTAPAGSTAARTTATTAAAPPVSGAAVYDAARKVVVMVTQTRQAQASSLDTWTWDGRAWTRHQTSPAPSARSDPALAFDEARRVVVLEGGLGSTGSAGDTWEWDGSAWTLRKPAHAPPIAQESGSMAYDPSSHRTILYQWIQQTWSWDGIDWTQLHPAHTPQPLLGTMVYDGSRVLLLAGSPDGNGGQTWGWTGKDWTLLSGGGPPEMPTLSGAAAYPTNGTVVLFGGGPGDDTWTWDGAKWSRAHPLHSPISSAPRPTPSAGKPFDGDWPPRIVRDDALNRVIAIAADEQGPVTAIYGWNGADWSAMTPSTPAPVYAGRRTLSAAAAEALIRQTVTRTKPVLFPHFPSGVDQVLVTADPDTFSLNAWNSDRSIGLSIGIVVPGNSNLGAANKNIRFRQGSAFYQYLAGVTTGWRSIWWTERPGQAQTDFGLKDAGGIPYALGASGLSEADFFALIGSLH
jgi:hypothetical protein